MYRHWKPIPNNGLGPADVGGSSLEKDPTHPPMASSKGKRIPCRRTSTDAPAQNVTMNIVLPPAAFKTEAEEGNEHSGGEREGGEGKGEEREKGKEKKKKAQIPVRSFLLHLLFLFPDIILHPSQGTSTIPSEILPAASAASLPR